MHLLCVDRDSGDSEAGLQPVFGLGSNIEVALVNAGFLTYRKPCKDVGHLPRSSQVLIYTSRGLQRKCDLQSHWSGMQLTCFPADL